MWVSLASSHAAEPELHSGVEVGELVPSFYMRAVTGSLMNKSVCYVCRNGARPVVMVLVRRMDPELKPLLQKIDKEVDRQRGDGLRSFGVMIADEPFKAVAPVQTFAFNHDIAMPFGVAPRSVAAAASQNLHADAVVTVVLYRKQRVVRRFAFRKGELSEKRIERVLSAVTKLPQDVETP